MNLLPRTLFGKKSKRRSPFGLFESCREKRISLCFMKRLGKLIRQNFFSGGHVTRKIFIIRNCFKLTITFPQNHLKSFLGISALNELQHAGKSKISLNYANQRNAWEYTAAQSRISLRRDYNNACYNTSLHLYKRLCLVIISRLVGWPVSLSVGHAII